MILPFSHGETWYILHNNYVQVNENHKENQRKSPRKHVKWVWGKNRHEKELIFMLFYLHNYIQKKNHYMNLIKK